jgi:hypothetical protein
VSTEKQEMIRQRAHEIWESEGRPEGAELRHWQQASEELNSDDRNEAAMLQAAGERPDVDPPTHTPFEAEKQSSPEPTRPVLDVEITTGEKPVRGKVKKTEGP